MNEIMGWKQGSAMAGVYIHLSGKQTDDALLPAMYGVKISKEENTHSQMFPIKCINCGELNLMMLRDARNVIILLVF